MTGVGGGSANTFAMKSSSMPLQDPMAIGTASALLINALGTVSGSMVVLCMGLFSRNRDTPSPPAARHVGQSPAWNPARKLPYQVFRCLTETEREAAPCKDITMSQPDTTNRQWVLAERPKGEPTKETLTLVENPPPTPGDGQMLLRTEYLSLDPYMRGRMSDAPSYAPPVEIGAVMVGGTMSRVVTSNLDGFAAGDWVLGFNGWQDYALSDGEGATNLGPSPAHPSWALGILGMPGFTAWAGLTQIGAPRPGETLAVAAATGPVGATVGQIGKILGCRVVGIAGGPDKCAYAKSELGFDACIDHKAPDFAERLAEASADGIDIYFENVGGKVLDAVIPLLNANARVPVCGLVSQYNATELRRGRIG